MVNETLLPIRNILSREKYRQVKRMITSDLRSLNISMTKVVIVQSLSHVQLSVTPWTAACQASLSITISQSLLKLMPIESMMPSSHLILCHPLLLMSSIFPASEFFPMSQPFTSGSQSIRASASVLLMNMTKEAMLSCLVLLWYDWLGYNPINPLKTLSRCHDLLGRWPSYHSQLPLHGNFSNYVIDPRSHGPWGLSWRFKLWFNMVPTTLAHRDMSSNIILGDVSFYCHLNLCFILSSRLWHSLITPPSSECPYIVQLV